jgi:hypothetical protein
MLNELIEKIAAETGLPVTTVAPVVGALLSHLGDVLPAPIAHHIAVALGVHQEGDAPDAPGAVDDQAATPSLGGFAGGLLGGGGGAEGGFPGATSLANVAASLMSGFLSGKR